MAGTSYSTTGMHLPTNRKLVDKLRQISFIGNLSVVILLAIALIFGIKNSLMTTLLFLIISGSTLFHATESSGEKIKKLFTYVPIIAGLIVITFCSYTFLISLEMSFYQWLSFIFIGLAISIPYMKFLSHRFHPAQFLALITLVPNLTATLGTFNYLSLLFVVMSLAILLRWPGRGFVSLFTAESVSSGFAIKLLASGVFIIPMMGFLALKWEQIQKANLSEMMAVMIVLVIITLATLIWFNIKLLYEAELERFVMKEELRVHSVNLKLNNEDLVTKMQELEEAKKKYAAELNYQDRFRDIAEGLG